MLLSLGDAGCHIDIGDMAEGRMGCQAVVMRLPAPGRWRTQSLVERNNGFFHVVLRKRRSA